MKYGAKAFAALPAAFLLLSCMTAGFAQEPAVRFDCEDIGVEARRILSDLKTEMADLAEREKKIAARENELKIIQQEVDNKIGQLKRLRTELERLLAEKQTVEKEKVKQLSKIYQKREPAGAARSLADMEKGLAVSILSMMRDKYAGAILDNMDHQKAVEYSTALGRLGR